jgi:hypothetical protein
VRRELDLNSSRRELNLQLSEVVTRWEELDLWPHEDVTVRRELDLWPGTEATT